MYLLEEINKRAAERPEDFIDRCRREYESEVERAVDDVLANAEKSVLVLISGPSGASKTTTAENIRRELEKAGHRAVVISMDEYFLDVTPWEPAMSNVTSMEYETVEQTTGMEPWFIYRVPFSREFTFHASKNVRPISISAQRDDSLVEIRASNVWDVQISNAGVYFDGTNEYGVPEEPLAYEVNFLLYYGANGQRWLTVTSPDSEAFLLTRDGNYFTVTSKGECSITIIDRTNGGEDVMLNTSVPSRATWYVVDLAADHADLQTGIE